MLNLGGCHGVATDVQCGLSTILRNAKQLYMYLNWFNSTAIEKQTFVNVFRMLVCSSYDRFIVKLLLRSDLFLYLCCLLFTE